MNFIAQDALDSAVLFKLFVYAQSADDRLKKEDISQLFEIPISSKRVDLSLDNLANREHISRWPSSGSCSIEVSGYRFVEEQLAQANSFMRRYADGGDKWLEMQTIGLAGVPASDRVVSRSDNQKTIEEIQSTLDLIEGELEKNNEASVELGDDKDVILGELDASKTLTSATSFRLSRLISLVMPALKYLSDKFGGAAVGEAAKQLIKLLFDLV